MNHINVLLEKLSQGNVVIIKIQQLLGFVLGLLDDSVGDLGIENEVTNEVVLVDEGGLIFAKVVKDLHDMLRLHDLLESVREGVHGPKIKEVTLSGEIHLQKAEWTSFGKPLAVDSQDGVGLCS